MRQRLGVTMMAVALMAAVGGAARECGAQTTRPATGDAAVPQQMVLDLGNRVSMKLVPIPAGKFLMGSPAAEIKVQNKLMDETQHEVTLTKPFYLGVTEVTQTQYQAVMGENPSRFKGPNLPVEPVSWAEAVEFCRRLSEKTGQTVRLPTEAEWEYACRAGTTGPYAGTGKLNEMGWHEDNSGGRTHPVASKKPNGWGLYDMHGNANEWCADLFGPYQGDATDPQGASMETARAMHAGASYSLRGGAWFVQADRCRSGSRGRGTTNKDIRMTGPGMRVAVTVK